MSGLENDAFGGTPSIVRDFYARGGRLNALVKWAAIPHAAAAVLSVVVPFCAALLLDGFLADERADFATRLSRVGPLLAVFVLLAALFQFAQYASRRLCSSYESRLRFRLGRALAGRSPACHADGSALLDLEAAAALFPGRVLSRGRDLAAVVAIALALALTHILLAAVAIVLVALFCACSLRPGPGWAEPGAAHDSSGGVQANPGGGERFSRVLLEEARRRLAVERTEAGARLLAGLAVTFCPLAVLVCAAAAVVDGRLTPGHAAAAVLLGLFLAGPSVRLAVSVAGAREAAASARRVLGRLEGPGAGGPPPAPSAPVGGTLVLSGINVVLPGEGRAVLEDVTLAVGRGEIVALFDSEGRAIAALSDLLKGGAAPSAGSVRVDGIDIAAVDSAARSRLVAVVDGGRELGHGTVEEHVASGRPDADLAAIAQAARDAGVAEFLPYLPRGLGSDVRDAGAILSPGQTRRILLAAALLLAPSALVLSGVFEGIDEGSGDLIWSALERKRAAWATLVLSRAGETPGPADRAYRIEAGRLREVAPAP